MKKQFGILSALILSIISCTNQVENRGSTIDGQVPSLLVFSRIEDNAIRMDSVYEKYANEQDVVFPLVLNGHCFSDAWYEWYKERSWERTRMDTDSIYNLQFKEHIEEYNVTARVFCQPSTKKVCDAAVYHFHSDKEDFYLKDWFLWPRVDSCYVEKVLKVDNIIGKGETYDIDSIASSIVLGNESELPCYMMGIFPFLLKDIDFDGKKEILVWAEGYNRYYLNAFKYVGGEEAKRILDVDLLCRYNNCNTTFDYKNKEITVFDGGSATAHTFVYHRSQNPKDALHLMECDDKMFDDKNYIEVGLLGARDTLNLDLRLYPYYGKYGDTFQLDSLVLKCEDWTGDGYINTKIVMTVKQK